MSKYVVEILLFAVSLLIFVKLAANDVIGNVLGNIIGFLFSTALIYAVKVIGGSLEDVLKVNFDTEKLLNIYRGDKSYRKTISFGGTSREFAYNDCLINRNCSFEVIDEKDKHFSPDDFVMEHYDTIFAAHSNSAKFNGLTIRLDDFQREGDHCRFYLSRSTVFHHLVTNRAIDYYLFDNVTLRDMYEYGPCLTPLANSKMSNHVGVNALVFLSDGRILVPRRKRNATISKNKVTSSIAVKLDFPRAGGDTVSVEHLLRGTVIDNLGNRLNLEREMLDLDAIKVEFLGFGRNIYEAGKPQFYYAVHLNIDTAEYYRLSAGRAGNKGLDIDSLIYVADYKSYCFDKKGRLCFTAVDPKSGRKTRIVTKTEMSYLCNLWHYQLLHEEK